MMLGARTAAWAKSGKPLPYDAEVEWLEFGKGPIISTGVVGYCIFKAGIKSSPGRKIVGYNLGKTYFQHYNKYSLPDGKPIDGISPFVYNDIVYSTSLTQPKQCLQIGEFIVEYNRIDDISNTQFDIKLLFGDSNQQWKYAIFEQDDSVVRDFIPVRFTNEDGESEGAMFDKVSGQLFRNSGTGAFIVGPDKTT